MLPESSNIIDALPCLIWTAFPDGQIDFLNQGWSQYTGLNPREASGWGWQSTIFPADLPRFSNQWRSIVASAQSGAIEARLRRSDGKYRWFLFRLSPIAEVSGEIKKWCGVSADIEDHKQINVYPSDPPHLNELLNTIPTTAWSARPDGSCDFINQYWLDYTGLREVDALGWGWTAAIHPADLERTVDHWKSCMATGMPIDTELRMHRHDGTYRWCLLRGDPLRDEWGNIRKWYVTNFDIEDRKQADALRGRERRLNEIINTIPSNTWSTLPDGNCDFLSQRWLNYAGMQEEQGMGSGWSNAVHPDDLRGLWAHWETCLASGTPVDAEARVRRHDGIYRWFLFVANPLRDESGHILRWYGTNIDIEDRKQAEAIRASERNLWRIVNNIPGFVSVLSPTGEVEEANQQLLEYIGKTLDELKGWKVTDVVHLDDRDRVIAALSNSIATGTAHSIEFRCRRADGIYRWFQNRIRPVRDAAGSINGWFVLLTDIEDKKRAEESRRDSENRLFKIINTIPTTAWSTRPDGYCDFLNHRWLGYAGLIEEQAMGWGWSVAIHPDDAKGLEKVWRFSLETGTPVDTEARIRRYDGVYRWFLFLANPLRDESGTIIKWYGTNVDIEDRKRAVDELRRSEARKTAILDSALDCIGTIDHDGRIIEFNPAAERTFGHQQEDVLGKLLADVLIPRSLQERHQQGLKRYLATGETGVLGKRIELTAIRADGSEFPVEVAITRIPLDGPPSFTGYLRDITERNRAEAELRRSEAALRQTQAELAHVTRVTTMGELAVSIAHEVNQPIAGVVINGNACLRWMSRVKEESTNLKEVREAIQRIIRDGTRAGEIITRIRAIFKKTDLAREPLDLNETIREVIILARGEMDKQRIVLRLELASDLPHVAGDRIQLQQVLLNLMLNAIEAMTMVMERSRDLVIRTQTRDEQEVMVTVRDSGIGLNPESIEHIFTAFHTTKLGGLGMGLSISRSIVENHSGRLWQTEHGGPGASFHFTLPSHLPQIGSDAKP